LSDARVQRRLAAVLAADIVGYSRLMEEDEAGTRKRVRSLLQDIIQPLVDADGGRVVKTTGDGILIEDPSAVDAVRNAVAVQAALAEAQSDAGSSRLEIRIGINIGDLIIEGDDIHGDGVNVAARLEGLCEPGSIYVSGSVHEHVIGKLAVDFEDLGPHALKNIARPVAVYRVAQALQQAASGSPVGSTVEAPTATGLPDDDKPSIAVLPFNNMSTDPEQEHFADGMTEDLITHLSTVPDLFVIARNSTFTYKGQSVDVRDVARDLGVRYVLEGSIRKAGNRIRVTAQFIDALTGGHIWAANYDRDLEDIFAVQDEVTSGIVGALQSRLLLAEAQYLKRKPPETLDAWGNVVNAKVKLFAFRQDDIKAAEPFARRAVEVAPDYPEANAVLGHIMAWRCWNGWTDDLKEHAREAVRLCELAVRQDPNDPSVLIDVGFALWWIGRIDQAVPHIKRAAELNPNSPIAVAMHGYALSAQGFHEEGLALCEKSFRLSPKDPMEYLYLTLLGAAQFHAGRYPEARETLERSIQINAGMTLSTAFLASTCVRLGDLDAGKAAVSFATSLSETAIPNLFRARPKTARWHELTDPIREIYDGPLPG